MDSISDQSQPRISIDPSLLQAWADVLENIPDAVFIVGGMASGGQILYLNSQATRMFGYERSELLNQSIDILVPPPVRERHMRHRSEYARAPKLRAMGADLALLGRRRDGTEFPIDVLLNHNDRTSSPATIAIVRDMTDRQRLEDALTQARDSAIRANEVICANPCRLSGVCSQCWRGPSKIPNTLRISRCLRKRCIVWITCCPPWSTSID
jgi:protein-histidine pros-kinase